MPGHRAKLEHKKEEQSTLVQDIRREVGTTDRKLRMKRGGPGCLGRSLLREPRQCGQDRAPGEQLNVETFEITADTLGVKIQLLISKF